MIEENLLTLSKQRSMKTKAQNHEVKEKRKRFYESKSAKTVLIDRLRSSATSSKKLCISFFSVSSVKKTNPFIGFFTPFDAEV
jgi:hypothetical protein